MPQQYVAYNLVVCLYRVLPHVTQASVSGKISLILLFPSGVSASDSPCFYFDSWHSSWEHNMDKKQMFHEELTMQDRLLLL